MGRKASKSPGQHGPGCGCTACLAGYVVARRRAEAWIVKAIKYAIAGRRDECEVVARQGRILSSAEPQELLKAGIYAHAIT